MSHFAGCLHDPNAAPDQAAEQALLRQFERSPDLPVQTRRSGRFWLASQTLPVWRAADSLPHPDGDISVVAGDPVVAEGDDALSPEASAGHLREAMLSASRAGLRRAQGTFAGAAWSASAERLVLATDKIGSRSLYVRREPKRLLFATSLRLLRALATAPESLDEQGLAESLFFGQPLGPRTVFGDTRVLRPGEMLVHDARSGLRFEPYFDLGTVPRRQADGAEAVALLHTAFARAIQRRLSPGTQEAFLSGGMDSRAVAAALVDAGQQVRSFCAAYPGSIDDVVGRLIAERLGTEHHTWHRRPADRVRVALDPFAIYARDHFPAATASPPIGRKIWSGDGGSVTLGHVYLTRPNVELAAGAVDHATVRRLFPALNRRPTRQLDATKLNEWAERATAGALEELRATAEAAPDRRLFLFYMRNDQARHLYHHFEAIDQSRIELLTPFFDGEFAELVASLPIDDFLYHGVYNRWITGFTCGAGDVYWQPYRGHLPGPHQNPAGTADQWDRSWYDGAEVRRTYRQIASDLLAADPGAAGPLIDRRVLRAAAWMNLVGLSRWNHEVAYARNLMQQLRRP